MTKIGRRKRHLRLFLSPFLAAVAAVLFWLRPARAYTPHSAEVEAMIAKGLKFLNDAPAHEKLGGDCLMGLAFVKSGADPSHPKITRAAARCKEVCRREPAKIRSSIYSLGIAIIFLCETDPTKYGAEIRRLLDALLLKQKTHGGWGYPLDDPSFGTTGDTSMTQYAALSMWTARYAGFDVSDKPVERVCNWLLRTQDPSGAWGYQGRDPGPGNFTRVPQSEVRLSLAAAGLGSVYICADLLRLSQSAGQKRGDGLPAILEVVEEDARKKPPPAAGVDPARVKRALEDGNRWFAQSFRINPEGYVHYYLYALERYQSFREFAEGRVEKEPAWYNAGVKFLKDTQGEDGSWISRAGKSADTAFAVLFLLRSTRKSIEKAVPINIRGTLTGGRELPSNVSDIQIQGGRIVGKPLDRSTDELLAILEDPDNPDFDYLVEFPKELKLSGDESIRARQKKELYRLITGPVPEARRLAVRALARSRDFDGVPTLIESLKDPDPGVVREARDGLRFISRKFRGYGLPDDPTEEEKSLAVKQWKQWYLSIRPDADLLE